MNQVHSYHNHLKTDLFLSCWNIIMIQCFTISCVLFQMHRWVARQMSYGHLFQLTLKLDFYFRFVGITFMFIIQIYCWLFGDAQWKRLITIVLQSLRTCYSYFFLLSYEHLNLSKSIQSKYNKAISLILNSIVKFNWIYKHHLFRLLKYDFQCKFDGHVFHYTFRIYFDKVFISGSMFT